MIPLTVIEDCNLGELCDLKIAIVTPVVNYIDRFMNLGTHRNSDMQDNLGDGCMCRLDFDKKLTSVAHYWNSSLPGKILRFVKVLTDRLMYMYLHRIDVPKLKTAQDSEKKWEASGAA